MSVAVEGAEALGVWNAAGAAVRFVFPAVVLAAQPLAVAARLVGEPAVAVRADVEERPQFAVEVADKDRRVEQVEGAEVAGPGESPDADAGVVAVISHKKPRTVC